MKKAFALIITVLYLAVSSGLAVQIHHCMGKIADFSFGPSSTDKCNSCGMSKTAGSCCKDELKFVKLQDSYKLLNVNYELAVPEADLHNSHYLANIKIIARVPLFNDKGHSPPAVPSLHILHCIFRI